MFWLITREDRMLLKDTMAVISTSTQIIDGPATVDVPLGSFVILVTASVRLETEDERSGARG
jgi:hypothetical protein